MGIQDICDTMNATKNRKIRSDCMLTNAVVTGLVSDYTSGSSARSLVKKYKMEYKRIVKVLTLSGIPLRSRSEGIVVAHKVLGSGIRAGLTNRKVSSVQLIKISDMRKAGVGWDKIKEEFGLGEDGARRLLKIEGLWVEPAHRSYLLDDTYFDKLDTPDKAYFFGLLMADGCVSRTRQGKIGIMSIALESSDRHILDEFREAICFSKHLKETFLIPFASSPNTRPQVLLRVHNQHMAESLVQHGCVPRKTYGAEYPYHLREDLHKHFIRGYFDGDGCIHIGRHAGGIQMTCRFVGSQGVLSGIKAILNKHLGVGGTVVKKVNIAYSLAYSGNKQATALHDYFYGSGGRCLSRKIIKWDGGMRLYREKTGANCRPPQ